MQPQDYCRDIAAPPGSNFYYSTLFQSAGSRRILYALFAFLAEVDGALRHIQDPAVGRLRLQWWSEEINRLRAGPVAHPISVEIGQLVQGAPGVETELREFIAAASIHLDSLPPAIYEQWIDRFTAVQGRIWAIAARLCAGADTGHDREAERIGGLLAAVEDLQQLPLSQRAGRCTLPTRELEGRGLSVATLGAAAAEDKASRYLFETLEQLRSDLLEAERRLAGDPTRSLLFCRIMARLGAALCMELKDEGALLLRRRTSLTPIRKLWIAWRTRLNA